MILKHIEGFLNETLTTKSINTQWSYKSGLNVFIEFLKEKKFNFSSPTEEIKLESFIGYPAYLISMGFSKQTCKTYGTAVRSFLNWMIIYGYIEPSPQQWLRLQKSFEQINRKRESKIPRWPKDNDVSKMLEAVKAMNEESPRKERNIAIVEVLACTGVRNFEACLMNVGDVDMIGRSAVVLGKGKKEREVFFSDTAIEALKKYWKATGFHGATQPAFCRHDRGAGKKAKRITMTSVRNIIKDVMAIADVSPFSPHYFRHNFGIKMLQQTGNLALVQDLMGHSDPASTRIYAKINKRDLQKAHREYFG